MYPVTAGAATSAGLALTGANIGWTIIAGVTLIALGGALIRLVPWSSR